nr:hypothetical protein [Tanacetum cinerariifolium]
MPKVLLQAWEKFFAIQHAQPEDTNELFQKLLEDLQIINEELAKYINSPSWNRPTFYDNDEEHSVQYKEYLENSSNAIAASNFNKEKEEPPQNSDIRQLIREECGIKVCEKQKQNMEDTLLELLEVCRQKEFYYIESDKIIKSSVKNLVQIPRKYEVTLDNESECDLPVCEDHSEILSDSNSDDISSDDDAFEDIEYVEASLPDSELVSLEEENIVYQEKKEIDLEDILQIQNVILREKLLSTNRLIADIEFFNDNPTPKRVLKSSSSFPILEKSDNAFSYSDNSLPEFDTFSDHMEETRNGNTTAHAYNSHLEYDSFCFEIESDQGRLTSIVMKDISDNSTNDPLLEEVDLFLASDNSIPPGIENFDYDSEGDIYFLEELLVDDSIPLPKMSHLTLIIMMIREVISVVMNNIDELNEDECFDPGGFNPTMIEDSRVQCFVPVHMSFTSFVCN